MKCVKRDSGRKCLTPRTCAHMKVSSIDVNIVEKSFTQEIALKYHVSEHTGNYRFKCDHCGKGFNRSGLQEQAQESINHTGVKNVERHFPIVAT